LINGVEIYHEVEAAKENYNQGNFEQFGFYVGEALATLLFGND